ncbi:MAG TPA: aconitate hydratase AcnA [Candidatus Baltobacteraceae bacterium]
MNGSTFRRELNVGDRRYTFFSLPAAEEQRYAGLGRLPYSLKILFENLLRHADGHVVTAEHLDALAGWGKERKGGTEIPFHPVRVLAGDSSGVPLAADLATMRSAMRDLGGNPSDVNPRIPVDLIIDHSSIVDVASVPDAVKQNLALEFQRNGERYAFMRWAQDAFQRFRIIPPGNGILHQINLEVLATVVWTLDNADGTTVACPDAMVGMDSHTPMTNGLGVLGWGVGAIEALAAMLGQPLPLAIPAVVGCRLVGRAKAGVTTTDIVLTLTQALRKHGVVAKFVEFIGPGLETLHLPERATLANMAPEYGATIGYFPIDSETLRYLQLTGRSAEHIALVEAYSKAQGLWRDETTPEPAFSDVIEFDLSSVEPSLAGPRRPQDRVALGQVPASFKEALPTFPRRANGGNHKEEGLHDGDVVIAALTSCTNTSNPSVMIGAGLLARNAVARGLHKKPWVKTSLAPGSRVVTDYLEKSGLQSSLSELGFAPVGFGCTTCMGNSGPLEANVAQQVDDGDLVVAAVLSGNRNFEGRIHPQAKASYLASPPLVVAYAIAGSLNVDLTNEPLGEGNDAEPVFLRDIWPTDEEIERTLNSAISPDLYRDRYNKGFSGSDDWNALDSQSGETFDWPDDSEIVKRPPFFAGVTRETPKVNDIVNARPLVIVGDSVTTDHISPIATIHKDSPAWQYLRSRGIEPGDIGTYNLRRINHEVMIRGTFANPRVKNELVSPTEGWFTKHMPDGATMSTYDAAKRYEAEGTAMVVVGGAEYGTGSSRDWAARGTRLLGVRAVIAEGFERIHRSNLVGMGVLPLQFEPGTTRKTLGLDGTETYTLTGLRELKPRDSITCTITRASGKVDSVRLLARIDTPVELDWYRHGGILPYVLRSMLS